MARKRFERRNGSIVGIFPDDHEVGFVSGRKGIRRVLISEKDLKAYPEEQQVNVLDNLYHSKQYEILNARSKEREAKAKVRLAKKKKTIRQASKEWLQHIGLTSSKETLLRYSESINIYLDNLSDIPVVEFGREENTKFLAVLKNKKTRLNPKKNIAEATQAKHIRHLEAFLNWCYDMEYSDRIHRLKKPTIPDKEMEVLNESDLDLLEAHLWKGYKSKAGDERSKRMRKNIYRAFFLARHTLFRSGVLWALEISDIDLRSRIIRVRPKDVMVELRKGVTAVEWKPKKMKWPNKPINDRLFEFLTSDLALRDSNERYFLDSGRGRAWRSESGKMADVLKSEMKKVELNINLKPFHEGVRATGITWLLNQPGVTPQLVQQLADHSDIQTTLSYRNTRKSSQKTAVDLLNTMNKKKNI